MCFGWGTAYGKPQAPANQQAPANGTPGGPPACRRAPHPAPWPAEGSRHDPRRTDRIDAGRRPRCWPRAAKPQTASTTHKKSDSIALAGRPRRPVRSQEAGRRGTRTAGSVRSISATSTRTSTTASNERGRRQGHLIQTLNALLAGVVLAAGVAGTALAQTPASPPAAQNPAQAQADANNPATHPVQPFAGVASENIFNVPRRDVAVEARSQQERSVTQPGNNAPVWREVNSDQHHYSSLPDKEAGVLIQRTGQQWRLFRNGVLTVWGGWLLILVPAAIMAFFAWRRTIPLKSPRTGRMIERFHAHRALRALGRGHLVRDPAISGIVILFGKHFLLPIMRPPRCSAGSPASPRHLHNLTGPVFTLSIIATFVVFVRDNMPNRQDMVAGAQAGRARLRRPRAQRALQRRRENVVLPGGMVLLGLVLSASGWVLDMIVPGMDSTVRCRSPT